MTPEPAAAAGTAAFAALRHDPQVSALLAACGDTPCHLVGGMLRDRALGLPTHDLDVVVAGRGRDIALALAAALPARFVLLGGRDFAAYRLVRADGDVIDIWDRQDATLADDLARRDLTVNSIAFDPQSGATIDPFGGLADLAARILRATTQDSFAGDPLRVLRLARLAQRLAGFTAEPATRDLARAAAPRLPEIAADRVRDELWLMLSHPAAERGLRLLADLLLYPGLWLGHPGRPSAAGAAADHRVAAAAAEELAALPRCAAQLAQWLARPAGESAFASGPGVTSLPEPQGKAGAGAWDACDLTAARYVATFRHLAAPPGPREVLVRMRDGGAVAGRLAAWVDTLLAMPEALPAVALDQRTYLHRHGRRWLTAACSAGGAAVVKGGEAAARWRQAAATLCDLARREGAALIAPPRWLRGDEVQRLLGVPPGPRVGEALAALIAAQVAGSVRSRDDALRFLQARADPATTAAGDDAAGDEES